MIKILMVCMGNICRSPMAEGIMDALIKTQKLDAFVDSAGTIEHHKGEAPDLRAQRKALQHGVNINTLKARPFKDEDFSKFDLIFVMDTANYKDIVARALDKDAISKVHFIMNEVFPNENIEVPDPYYGGDDGFENVFSMLLKSCKIIAQKIQNGEYGN